MKPTDSVYMKTNRYSVYMKLTDSVYMKPTVILYI